MKAIRSLYKTLRSLLIFTSMVSLTISFLAVEGLASPTADSTYYYKFFVNEDGFTRTVVNYESSVARGSSWVFVPKFSNWSSVALSGRILQSEIVETESVVNVKYYFYQAFKFSFESNGSFNMSVQFNMSAGALIIEPRGIFFSPQIGFQADSDGKAEVFLPNNSSVVEAVAIAQKGSYSPTKKDLNYVVFDLYENLIRLQIEFKTGINAPAISTLKQGIFTFQAVKRYESYASDILNLFNYGYNGLMDLFNVTLESVEIRFFIPEFHTFLSIGGYVPFTGGKIGDIHINVFFIRGVKGVIEIIALHELIHHFLYKAGLSPRDLLWFHEGIAQYVSIEIADALGYEGALSERGRLEEGASQLIQLGENFNFLQQWKPETQPADVSASYMASYYVVSRLASMYGELNYYKNFFRLINGRQVNDNNVLAYHLSLAANTSVVPTLKRWGFKLVDLHVSSTLVDEAERAVHGLNPIFQPYKFLAEYLYKQALTNLENDNVEKANQYLEAVILIAKFAPILTVITIGGILIAIIYINERRRALSNQPF